MVELAEQRSATVSRDVERFEAFAEKLTLGGPAWLPERRREAIERFAALGYPTTRHEEWLYTNVSPIEKTDYTLADRYRSNGIDGAALDAMTFDVGDVHRIVFVNGHFSPELTDLGKLPKGVKIDSLAASLATEPAIDTHLTQYAAYDEQAFVALNTAFMTDGLFVHLESGAKLDKPLHVVFVAAAPDGPVACHPRNLIVVEPNAEGTIIESHVGRDGENTFTNEITEIFVAENAHLQHYKVARGGNEAMHVATLQVRQERSGVFYSQNICLGGKLTRNDINTYLNGEGIDSTFDGLFVAGGEQHVDNHTRVDHAMPHCQSHELYKGILDDKATSCFNGKIFVHEDAQKTDAFQSNMNMLLSDTAQANTKPQLEIFADDVKCSHGATIGQLDADALFYLQARGLPASYARSLLTYAFANDVVQRIKLDALRESLDTWLFNRLPSQDEIGTR